MLSDRDLILRQMADPALVRMSQAIGRLASTITWMSVGAHPDDEHSGLLAALRFKYGMRIVILCSTRGEGGQNTIGPERGGALGAVRTREMHEAALKLDASVAWVGHGPEDTVFDFGFSKNGEDTLARWGEDTIVGRVVEAYRRYRPDIVETTFLDVPGQHGHHRAMTRAAIAAFDLAADASAFPEQIARGLSPWQVAKLYLPAWSGAGGSYDDEVPPPEATVTVQAPGRDPATGATYAQIGEWSRVFHATQSMGRWREAGPSEWRLHLALSSGRANAEDDVRDHLPRSVGALAQLPGASSAMAAALQQAQAAIEATIAAFPNPTVVAASAAQAATAIEAARAACPVGLKPIVDHRLERKMIELDAVLAESAGPQVRARADPPRLSPGGQGKLFVSATSDGGEAKIAVDVTARDGIHVAREGVENGADRFRVTVSEKAEFTSPYPVSFDPLAVDGEVGLGVSTTIGARIVRRAIRLEEPLRVLPATSLMLDPDAVIVNLARPLSEMHVAARVDGSEAVGVALMPPAGWGFSTATAGFVLNPPANVRPGRFSIAATVAGHAASRIQRASYPHIGSLEWAEPAALPGLAVEAALPEGVRIAYVGGGNDRVDFWLRQLGLEVTSLDAAALEHADFAPFTTIVIGIFAFGTRPDLAAARGRLRRWVEAGGHLVTLYHRPSDGWSPDDTPPRRLEIGTPSLRWRVTDPSAPVTLLAPDHALLTAPNRIAAGDWAGWDKERGLYFAARWDEAYIPLLAMSDKDEVPLSGSLLSAIIGRGRHTHTALVLHHQLEKLVPGAFRLLANLVQRA